MCKSYHQGGKFTERIFCQSEISGWRSSKTVEWEWLIFGVPLAQAPPAAKLESGQVLAGSMDDVLFVIHRNETHDM